MAAHGPEAMSKKKTERRTEAINAEMQRTVNRLYAISIALLRSETVFVSYREHAKEMFASGKSDDALVEEIPDRVSNLEASPLLRAGSMMMLYLGTLYSVVEAWRKWGFADPNVDRLLKNAFVDELKKYRNAVFHISEATDPRIMQWTAERDRVEWAQSLAAAFRNAILDWHGNLGERVTVHLLKKRV